MASPTYAERLRPLVEEHGLPFFITENLITTETQVELPEVEKVDAAMILYTSGTTGQPKGAVISHGNVQAQVEALVEAWGWSAADAIVEFLPLHHTHGIVNVVTCALWSGARLDCLEKFDAGEIWRRIARGELTLLMAVPTIYRRLVAAWEAETAERRAVWSAAAARLRLMVSGSAALPVPLFERWREITGHVLLERYGMTEIGMALSNPLDGERRAGTVGRPLPGVEVRLVGDGTATLPDDALPDDHSGPGEVQVRGPGVFPGLPGPRGGDARVVHRRRLVQDRRCGGARRRHLPVARPQQRRHHQDRWREGFGPGNRGGAARAPGDRRVRRRRYGGRGLGRVRLGGGRARCDRRGADSW